MKRVMPILIVMAILLSMLTFTTDYTNYLIDSAVSSYLLWHSEFGHIDQLSWHIGAKNRVEDVLYVDVVLSYTASPVDVKKLPLLKAASMLNLDIHMWHSILTLLMRPYMERAYLTVTLKGSCLENIVLHGIYRDNSDVSLLLSYRIHSLFEIPLSAGDWLRILTSDDLPHSQNTRYSYVSVSSPFYGYSKHYLLYFKKHSSIYLISKKFRLFIKTLPVLSESPLFIPMLC